MMEVGPWRWDGKSKHDFYVKEGGWEEYTTMVFGILSLSLCVVAILTLLQVDQPAGTGFSYTSTDKYVHTMEIVSRLRLAVTTH